MKGYCYFCDKSIDVIEQPTMEINYHYKGSKKKIYRRLYLCPLCGGSVYINAKAAKTMPKADGVTRIIS